MPKCTKSPTEKHIKLKADSSIASSMLLILHVNNKLPLYTFPKKQELKRNGTVHLHQLLLLKYILIEKLHMVENKTSTMKTSVMQYLLKTRWVTTQKVAWPSETLQKLWKSASLTRANSCEIWRNVCYFGKMFSEMGLAIAVSALWRQVKFASYPSAILLGRQLLIQNSIYMLTK